jgi:serine/threonine protein kinase
MQGGSNSAAEGDILAGKYRVERILGIGGMGVVVAAHHLQLDEKVALKFLLPEALGNSEAVARFAREARAAVKIKSEHVARVSDVGTLPNGAPYMVMEYLDGGDLAAWLQERGPLPIEQAVEFVLQACEAIACAKIARIADFSALSDPLADIHAELPQVLCDLLPVAGELRRVLVFFFDDLGKILEVRRSDPPPPA